MWIPATEVAKLVRHDLKRAFPGVKFSVRTSKYAGGASIHVSYPAGQVDERAVSDFVRPYGGAGFDGMTDSQYYVGTFYCDEHGAMVSRSPRIFGRDEAVNEPCCAKAREVSMGANYVFAQREW